MGGFFARKYPYVGPQETLTLLENKEGESLQVRRGSDVIQWVERHGLPLDDGEIIATFVISRRGRLLIEQRECEHVVCAGGAAVLSAGEMTFLIDRGDVQVTHVTNQSTGYCPRVQSWKYVHKALRRAAIVHPAGFSMAFEFRRCDQCGNINLVKDDWYVCAFCDRDLPKKWNVS